MLLELQMCLSEQRRSSRLSFKQSIPGKSLQPMKDGKKPQRQNPSRMKQILSQRTTFRGPILLRKLRKRLKQLHPIISHHTIIIRKLMEQVMILMKKPQYMM